MVAVAVGDGRLKLDLFEGPLDLLLYLIRKDEIDILDIPIIEVTQQYQTMLDHARAEGLLDLDFAGDYFLMAATLIQIKTRLLLPRGDDDGVDDEDDPRRELVQQLLEYERFKEAASLLRECGELASAMVTRPDAAVSEHYGGESCLEVDLLALAKAFRRVMEEKRLRTPHVFEPSRYTVGDRIRHLLSTLSGRQRAGGRTPFQELFEEGTVEECVVHVPGAARAGEAGLPPLLAVRGSGHPARARARDRATGRSSGPPPLPSSTSRPSNSATGSRSRRASRPSPSRSPRPNPSRRRSPRQRRTDMSVDAQELLAAVEAVVFVASEPVTLERLRETFPDETSQAIEATLEHLARLYEHEGRGLALDRVAGGWRIATRPAVHVHVARFVQLEKAERLSLRTLETLSVIAYKQPVTAAEIQEIRGVDPSGTVRTLLDKGLVKIAGRKKVVGRPFVYATTRQFLRTFRPRRPVRASLAPRAGGLRDRPTHDGSPRRGARC